MQNYLDLLKEILENGDEKQDRTKTGTLAVFAKQMRFDLNKGFPILTTKKIHFKSIVAELLWFLKGSTKLDFLHTNGCTIWNEWADEKGNLGPIYGKQWRNWEGKKQNYDQIAILLQSLKNNPTSRRMILSGWNLDDLPDEKLSPQENVKQGKMALACCHLLAQLYVSNGKLFLLFFARSQDFFLGAPFNIASYALLTHLLALHSNLKVGELIWFGGDVHLYKNHLAQAKMQLQRKPYPLPKLVISQKKSSIDDYEAGDFLLQNYKFYPSIKAPISV